MWQEINNELVNKFEFSNFVEAFDFMSKVAIIAEEQDHHPWWSNLYNVVAIKLSTHSAGNIVTQKDWQLANAIDLILKTSLNKK